MTGPKPLPWRRVSEGPAVDHHILKIREVTVEDPRDGSHHQRVLIEPPDWVNVIPVTRDGKLVLIRQFRFGIAAPTLEVPGGAVEPGEAPARTAARELEEETGYRPGRIESLGFCHPNPAIQSNKTHFFLALDCEKHHDGNPDATEDIALELVERTSVAERVRSGEISHALVLAALYLETLYSGAS